MNQSVSLRILNRREVAGFEPYLLPETRQRLRFDAADWVAFGAVTGRHSCGVIAAQMEGSSARITDLFVDETVRRSKIGGQLLDKLLEELQSRSVTQIRADYALSDENLAAMDALFVSRGFVPPEITAVNYSTHTSFFRDSGIIARAFRPSHRTPENLCTFAELSPSVLETLAQEEIPAPLSWEVNRHRAIPEVSVALMNEGEVCAYMLCGESADGGCVVLSTISRSDAPQNAFLSLLLEVLNRFFYRCGGHFPVYFSATTEYINDMALRLMEGHFTAFEEHSTVLFL